jgi:hypothetical protein
MKIRKALIVIGILVVAVVSVSAWIQEEEKESPGEPGVSQSPQTPTPTQSLASEPKKKKDPPRLPADEAEPLQVTPSRTKEEEPPPGFEHISGWPYGGCNAVTSDGDYLYLGVGGVVIIVDVTDPAHAEEVASIVTPDAVLNLAVEGDMLYVANRRGGIRVIDVSDPLNPWEVGSDDTEYTQDIYLSYPYAYMAAGGDLRIVDVSEPTNPVLVGVGIPPTEIGGPWGVYVIDDYAYTAFGEGLQIFDVSDPSNPIGLGQARFEQPGGLCRVYVHSNRAYVHCAHNGLHVIDVSDPSNPVVANSLYTSDWIWDVDGAGDYVYVHGWEALRVLDISEPSNPVEVGGYAYETRHDYGDIHVSGNYAYATDTYKGVRIFDVSDPSNPARVGFFETSGPLWDVQVSDTHAYVANDDFYVLDIGDPTKPIEIGSLFTSDDASSVYVHGNRAYLSSNSGLYIIDVSNPSSPVEIGFFDPSNDADAAGGGIDFENGYIYLARELSGLFVIDVSDPSSPQQVAQFRDEDFRMSISDVFVLNDYAYFTAPSDDEHAGFYVLDVSDPANPVEMSAVPMSDPPQSVHVSGNHAYVACDRSGLYVFDIADPANPIEVGAFDIRDMPYGPGAEVSEVDISEGYAYMTLRGSGLLILDVGDPSNPVEVGRIESPEAFGVCASNDYLFVADLRYGLWIYGIQQPVGPKAFIPLAFSDYGE